MIILRHHTHLYHIQPLQVHPIRGEEIPGCPINTAGPGGGGPTGTPSRTWNSNFNNSSPVLPTNKIPYKCPSIMINLLFAISTGKQNNLCKFVSQYVFKFKSCLSFLTFLIILHNYSHMVLTFTAATCITAWRDGVLDAPASSHDKHPSPLGSQLPQCCHLIVVIEE